MVENKVKTFGSGTREVPADKASKWYPVEDDAAPKKVRKSHKPTNLRPTIQPGSVLIILAGRFRGKRVINLKSLGNGVLLVTGPFKINGVPLRRVNARYVIATSTKVDISSVDLAKYNDEYFKKEKGTKSSEEEKFYKAGDKVEKKQVPEARKSDQKEVDGALLKSIKATPHLAAYLGSSFSLSKNDRPHLMKF